MVTCDKKKTTGAAVEIHSSLLMHESPGVKLQPTSDLSDTTCMWNIYIPAGKTLIHNLKTNKQ